MNGLKMSVFKLVLSFSVGVIAADNIYRNTERDKVFDSSRDFAGLTGTDTALWERNEKWKFRFKVKSKLAHKPK